MRRYVVWIVSSVAALAVYMLAGLTGLSDVLVLVLTFVGAMAGAFAGTYVTQRR